MIFPKSRDHIIVQRMSTGYCCLRILLLWLIFITTLYSQEYKSIHQIQHEYYRDFFSNLKSQPADSITPLQERTMAPAVEVFGYHPYWMGTAWQNYNFNLLSTIAYFGAAVNGNGTFSNLHGWPVTGLINKAHAQGVEVVLVAILFNSNDIEKLLSNSSYRKTLINNLITQVKNAGADGVNIDFEGVPSSQKKNLTTFMSELTSAFHDTLPGSQVTIATPAVDWSNAFDYKALASVCDGLMIMGYDYHWSGSSSAGPVAPLTGWGTYNVTWTVNDYLSKTAQQKDKLILGCPYYGIQWPTVSGSKGASTTGTGTAKFYSEAEALAQSYGKLWDESSLTPWYRFQNPGWYQGWYDDSLSLSYKYDFILNKNLKGIGIWALGYDGSRPELWGALSDHFGTTSPPTTPTHLRIVNVGNGHIEINFNGAETSNFFHVYQWHPDSVPELLGSFTSRPITLTNLKEGEITYIQISGSNEYGESPLTEVLAVIPTSGTVPILIVNGFDRVSGTTNTFDFIKRHAPSILATGYAFDACSNEAVESGAINLGDYSIVDWILGEEGTATSSFTATEQQKVSSFLEGGGALFVSGSEIGYDLVEKGDSEDQLFFRNYLKASYITDAAGGHQGTYKAYGTDQGIFADLSTIAFDNGSRGTYDVDWPDGIKPIDGAITNMKYSNVDYTSKGGAGIQYVGTFGNSSTRGVLVYLAIPFETIYPLQTRNAVMEDILKFFFSNLDIVVDTPFLPTKVSISNIYPNPSNLEVNFVIQLPASSDEISAGIIRIVDLLGKTVAELPVTNRPGQRDYTLTWNGKLSSGRYAPSGIYVAVLQWKGVSKSRKFTLLK